VSTSSWRPSSPARPVEEYPLLMARPGRLMEGSPPRQLSPPRRRRGGRAGRLQGDAVSISASLILSNSPKQQLDTWRTRLLAPCVCALAAGPLAPEVERRPTPRFGRRSCPGAVPLRFLLPHASPRIRRTRCCLGPRQGEPSWPPWQQQGAVLLRLLLPPVSPRVRRTRCCLELPQGEPSWLPWLQKGGGDTLGGGPAAAGSCSTAPSVPAESSSVQYRCSSGFLQ
jgi:hypothetical protein